MVLEARILTTSIDASTGSAGESLDAIPVSIRRLEHRQRTRWFIRLAAVASDLLALTLAYFAAGLVRFGEPNLHWVTNVLAVFIPIYLMIASMQQAFSVVGSLEARRGIKTSLMSFFITLSMMGLTMFFLQAGTDFSRSVLGLGSILAVILLPIGRLVVAKGSRSALGQSPLNEVVICDDFPAPLPTSHAVVLNAHHDLLLPDLNNPAMLDRLGRCLKFADKVTVACHPERRELWAAALKGADVEGHVLAPELDQVGALGLGQWENSSTLIVAAGPLSLTNRFLKRSLDLVLATVSIVLLLPLLALIAAAVKLDSRGPVLFVQKRVGLGNRLFSTYKFRTMHVHLSDHAGLRSASREDERVTRVGRLLRRTSLDELPQLFNVLEGVMSVVGPRPHALGSRAEDQLFWDIDLNYWHRHAIKPGMTGLAQIRGFRGATRRTDDLKNRLQADLEYLAGWTIWRDISIIVATFRVLFHKNAF